MEKEIDTLSYASQVQGMYAVSHSVNEPKSGLDSGTYSELKETADDEGSSKYVSEKASKKKRGKATGSSKIGASENDLDNQELPSKSKKNQRKNKDTSSSDTKSGTRKGLDKVKEDALNISEEWITQRILAIAPDLDELGGSHIN